MNEAKINVFNTGETAEELRMCYNSEGSLLRRVQLRLLDMLLYLDRVCRENNIDYRIDGGTVLGAMRHGGFIPWDDDVDVVVENRKDYRRLCKFLKEHPHEQYVLQNDTTDPGCIKYWSTLRDLKSEYVHTDPNENIIDSAMKYRGLQIDLFPYEAGIIKPLYFKYATLGRHERMALLYHQYIKQRLIHKFRKVICNPVLHALSILFGDKNIYMHAYGEGFPCQFPKNVLLPHSTIMFEGHEFPCPANPKKFCELLYGDYMNLPPQKKRDHHQVSYRIWD